MDYQEFLVEKLIADVPTGFDPEKIVLNPMLFDFQRDLVLWALRRGRIFSKRNRRAMADMVL